MTGSQFSKMRVIPKYDPEIICPDFETESYVFRKENELIRAIDRVITKGTNQIPYDRLRRFRRNLRDNIDNDRHLLDLAEIPLSSWIQKRELRRVIISNATAFIDKYPYDRFGFLTSLDYRLSIPISDIYDFNIDYAASKFQKAILKKLSRISRWRGYLFAFWEMDAEPNRNLVQIHAHIIASDDVLDATKAYLKQTLTISRAASDTIKSRGYTKDISGKTPREIANLFGYCLKTEIKAKIITLPDKNGKTQRAKAKHYMNDEMLVKLWSYLSDKNIGDVTTLIGIRATKGGFISTR